MNYIIDGHNLIAKLPGLNLRMPDDEQRLIELLSNFGKLGRHRLEVYFDGAPVGQAGESNYGVVRAYFISASGTADDAIRKRLAKLGRAAKNWVVVSTDREVQSAAHEAHARVMKAEEFARLLQAEPRSEPGQVEGEPDHPLSEAEMREWLALFKERGKKK